MDTLVGYAEIVGAVIAAFGLAVGLEWVGLYGLTSLMSDRHSDRNSGDKSALQVSGGRF